MHLHNKETKYKKDHSGRIQFPHVALVSAQSQVLQDTEDFLQLLKVNDNSMENVLIRWSIKIYPHMFLQRFLVLFYLLMLFH